MRLMKALLAALAIGIVALPHFAEAQPLPKRRPPPPTTCSTGGVPERLKCLTDVVDKHTAEIATLQGQVAASNGPTKVCMIYRGAPHMTGGKLEQIVELPATWDANMCFKLREGFAIGEDRERVRFFVKMACRFPHGFEIGTFEMNSEFTVPPHESYKPSPNCGW